MTKTFIKNATWALTGEKLDICLGDGVTVPVIGDVMLNGACAAAPAGTMDIPADADVLDADGELLLPALFDLHAKIAISGKSLSECVERADDAAHKGGVCGMLVMPTAGRCFDNGDAIESFAVATRMSSETDMYPAGCISLGMEGEQQAPYNTLKSNGVNILTDAENVPHNLLMLHRAMKYAAELGLTFAIRGDVPVLTEKTYMHPGTTSYKLGIHGTPACAEEIGIETVLRLAADAGAKVHIQTVSTAEGVAIIRRAKASGKVQVTAEVALHHLLYTHENVGDYDTTFKTLPPLREQSDCEALLEGVKDGTIDCIVTDHTPCIPFAKKQDFITAPQGMLALDTFLPALYTHLVKPGKLTWEEVVRACSLNPVSIADPTWPNKLLLFNPDTTETVAADTLPTGTLNTPLLGTELLGSVTML